ncbi:MAG: DUF2135 domain-containing protein [bacterium]|nr:DUF2135 domain-containing protein [bacterium]
MKHIFKQTIAPVLILLGFFLLTVPARGQAEPNRMEPPVVDRTALLKAVVDGTEQPLKLSRLDVKVDITGKLAETRITMTFKNPYPRRLEGQLVFPLPEGAFVSGYALNIKGKMVDGVVVEKQKARVVFEKIVRQRIDPGLVEWVKGNNFRTRVYPIEPNKTRTVMVRYVSQLDYINGTYSYRLPLNYKQQVDEFSLRMGIASSNLPTVFDAKENKSLRDLDFKLEKGLHTAHYSKKNFLLDKNVVIAVPDHNAPGAAAQNVQVEKNADGRYYFCIHDMDGSREVRKKIGKKRRSGLPDRITILWDASGSRAGKDRQKELALLKAYFNQAGFKKKKVEVLLHFFRNRKAPGQRFRVVAGNIDKIVEAIGAVDCDGGTTLGAIAPGKGEKKPDFYLLFSDGNHNIGSREPAGFKAPLYIASSAADADYSFLRYLALKSGGIYFNLNRRDTADVVDAIGNSPYTFIAASVSKGSVEQIQPACRKRVRGNFLVSGILRSQKAVVTLNYGRGTKILKRVSFRLSRKQAKTGNILRTFWAQEKVRVLALFPEINKKELLKMGKAYGLVTPGTSLMVLESLEQYIQYRIRPPKSLPMLRAEYEKRTAHTKMDVEEGKERKLEKILELWKERVQWWKKDFSIKPKPRKKKSERRTQNRVISHTTDQSSTNEAHLVGAIYGKVLTEDKEPLPGVHLTITSPVLDGRVTTISNGRGRYRFLSLSPGTYRMKAELDGFKTSVTIDIRVIGGQRVNVVNIMRQRTVSEEIVVCGAPTIDRSSTVGTQELDEEFLRSIPSSRSVKDYIDLSPGVTGHSGTGAPEGMQYNLDGVDMTAEGGKAFFNLSPGVTGGDSGTGASIQMAPWNPDTPYIKAIKEGKPDTAFARYMEQKKQHGNSPAFFLDCADYFHQLKKQNLALQVLSNVAEIQLEDVAFLRILGHRLLQWKHFTLAEEIFERILELRPEEPQSFRDAALAAVGLEKYKRAATLLYKVVLGTWGQDFRDIEVISLMDINGIIGKAPETASLIDRRFRKLLAVDLRVVLTWDSNMTDMDLWVTDPRGEKAYFGHPRTEIGGRMSRDNTAGYGPEEFLLKKALKGEYKIEVNYFGSSKSLPGPITLQVDIFTDYGRKTEKKKSITVRLEKKREVIKVGDIAFGA